MLRSAAGRTNELSGASCSGRRARRSLQGMGNKDRVRANEQMQGMLEAQANNVVGDERGRADESKVEGGFRGEAWRRMHSTTIVEAGSETRKRGGRSDRRCGRRMRRRAKVTPPCWPPRRPRPRCSCCCRRPPARFNACQLDQSRASMAARSGTREKRSARLNRCPPNRLRRCHPLRRHSRTSGRTLRRTKTVSRRTSTCSSCHEKNFVLRAKGRGNRRPTLDLGIIRFLIPHQQRRGLSIQRVRGVRVPQELWEEDLEDVDHVEHGRPGLVDDVEADRAGELVDVGCAE